MISMLTLVLSALIRRLGVRVKSLRLQEHDVDVLGIGAKRLMGVETGTLLVMHYRSRKCTSVRYFATPGHEFGDVDLFILPGSLNKIQEVC